MSTAKGQQSDFCRFILLVTISSRGRITNMFGRIWLAVPAILAALAISLTVPVSASAEMGVASTSCSNWLQVSSSISERACVILNPSSVQARLEVANSGSTSKSVVVGVATMEPGHTFWCQVGTVVTVPAAGTAGVDCWRPRVSGSSYQTQGNAHNNFGVPVNVFSPTVVG